MQAIVMTSPSPLEQGPIELVSLPDPQPGLGQIVVKVSACGVCRSNLHMIEGDWVDNGVPAFTPIVPGHEVVGTVAAVGDGVDWLPVGTRVGVQPLWSTCGHCRYCLTARDPLCPAKQITGETVHGGYAEYMLATAAHAYVLPDGLSDAAAAPLFCPGITAYGALAKAAPAPGRSIAVWGFGGVGHMVVQFARLAGAEVVAVARTEGHLELAEELGARPVDGTDGRAGERLAGEGGVDASIVFAPSSAVAAQALAATRPGGVIVVGAAAEIGALPFVEEKAVLGSLLGNRQQMREVLEIAAAGGVRAHVETFPLAEAAQALARLKAGQIAGRAVLTV